MSSYIIAGEAGSQAFTYCEYLGKKLSLSAPSVSVHIIMKHPTEWEAFLDKIINGYGFKTRSSPIIFTTDGKLIGDKSEFKKHILFTYGLKSDLDPILKSSIASYDQKQLEDFREKQSRGPTLAEFMKPRIAEIKAEGSTRVIPESYERKIDKGLEFFVKSSEQLSPFLNDSFQYQVEVSFMTAPELAPEEPKNQLPSEPILINEELAVENNPTDTNEDEITETQEQEETEENQDEPSKEDIKPSEEIQPSQAESSDEEDSLIQYEVNDANLNHFIEKFSGAKSMFEVVNQEELIPVPDNVKALLLPDNYVIDSLRNEFILAINPYAIVENEMLIFQSEGTDPNGNWLIRDTSMMKNWLKVLNIPPQRPVYRDGAVVDPVIPKEPIVVKNLSGSLLNQRGYSDKQLDLSSLECTRNSSLRLNTINIHVRHLLTEADWEAWHALITEIDAIGFYQFVPYGEQNYQPLRSGIMQAIQLPIEKIDILPLQILLDAVSPDSKLFTLEDYDFDHIIARISPSITPRALSDLYVECIEKLDIIHKNLNCGMNIILMKNFLFLAPVYRPWVISKGRKLFAEPLWYIGIFNLPILPKEWPETGGVTMPKDPLSLLEKSSKFNYFS
ncbi:unnamed protein product [Blepharisma stoltei]|uniref:Uncharacterized protein n=1 Tax=Blepharisma stoltei TaxID=1481888 RepID=A0AAU9IBZ2_9CILI|nr:unnamed protein product [Blepharisma stoltei]